MSTWCARPLLANEATNTGGGIAPAYMVVSVYVPTPGCREITGDYRSQKLSFVVCWVTPEKLGW